MRKLRWFAVMMAIAFFSTFVAADVVMRTSEAQAAPAGKSKKGKSKGR